MTNLKQEIQHAINRNCGENASNTPDFILAEYLTDSLEAWNKATVAREKWYGRHQDMPAPVTPDSIAAVRSNLDAQIAIDCGKPTPPTPAGAGTETPRTDAEVDKQNEKGIYSPELVPADFARQLERELTSLRRQAEADRATKQELQEKLGAYLIDLSTICAANDIKGLPCQQPRFIGEYIASLRAQLATADKDRERKQAALEMASGRMAYMAGAFGNRFSDEDKNINRVVFKEIRAALQPSPSLDHGATGTPQPI